MTASSASYIHLQSTYLHETKEVTCKQVYNNSFLFSAEDICTQIRLRILVAWTAAKQQPCGAGIPAQRAERLFLRRRAPLEKSRTRRISISRDNCSVFSELQSGSASFTTCERMYLAETISSKSPVTRDIDTIFDLTFLRTNCKIALPWNYGHCYRSVHRLNHDANAVHQE